MWVTVALWVIIQELVHVCRKSGGTLFFRLLNLSLCK